MRSWPASASAASRAAPAAGAAVAAPSGPPACRSGTGMGSSSSMSDCSTLRMEERSRRAASSTCAGRMRDSQYTRAIASLRRTSASSWRT
eukprot:324146-Chlamydomonas_euryale.AAC.1